MRLCFVYITLIALLAATSGCKTFQKQGSGNKSLYGLKRKGAKNDLSEEMLDPLGARNTNRLLLDDLSPSQLPTTIAVRGFGGVDEEQAQQDFNEGQRLHVEASALKESSPESGAHQDKFLEAANQFRLAASRWPDSQIEEDASYLEGESFFFADRYVQANRAYEKLIANYAGTRYLDLAEKRRYTIALYWLELSEHYKGPHFTDAKRPKTNLVGEAKRVLHRIRIDDPTGKLADDAALAVGKAFLKEGNYYEAADAFEDLRRNYPGSKHQFTAHMLELEARLKGYQGKSYDDTPLRKADELMKSIVRQFPEQSQKQLPYLEQQSALIRKQIAERDYSMGQYFENRGENRAAKFYYEQVAEKFKNTEFGETVREQIETVAALPPEPEQHGKWLIDLFPKTEKEKPLIRAGDNERRIFR